MVGTRLLTLVLALVAAIVTGCATSPPPPDRPVSTALVLDISGSAGVIELEERFWSHLEQELSELTEGSTLTVLALDGGGLSQSCPPVEVVMALTGNSDTTRNQQRKAIVGAARQRTSELLACTKERAVPGSDLVGAIRKAEGELDPEADSRKLVLVSDGVQWTDELMFAPESLMDPAWRQQELDRLSQQDLLPDLTGVRFVITDLGAGTMDWTASQVQALHTMWEEYATAAHTTLYEK